MPPQQENSTPLLVTPSQHHHQHKQQNTQENLEALLATLFMSKKEPSSSSSSPRRRTQQQRQTSPPRRPDELDVSIESTATVEDNGEEEEEEEETFFLDHPKVAGLAHVLVWPLGILYSIIALFLGTYVHIYAAVRRRCKAWTGNALSYGRCLLASSTTIRVPPLMPRLTSVGANAKMGLYWYGLGDVCERDDPILNNHFDPTKPTVIYVHGYQPRTIIRRFRESFNWIENDDEFGIDVNAADHWLKAGWNVATFFWNTAADEPFIHDAEAKIWTNNTSVGMRYRILTQCGTDVRWRYVSSRVPCVSQQLADVLRRRFPQGSQPYRLVGHSLGAQVVIHAATLLAQAKKAEMEEATAAVAGAEAIPDTTDTHTHTHTSSSSTCPPPPPQASFMLPSRIALLDAFFTLEPKRYLGWRSIATVLKEEITTLVCDENCVFEQYQTSILSFAANMHLKPLTAFFDLNPSHIPWYKLRARHISAPYLYFMSMASPEVGKNVLKEVGGAWMAIWSEFAHLMLEREGEEAFVGLATTSDESLRMLMSANVVGDLWEMFTSYRFLLTGAV